MARKIAETAGYVHVTDPATGETVVLAPGDTVPSKFDDLVGDHATSGTRPKAAAPAGPSQTPGVAERGAAAQKTADEQLAAAEAAEAEKSSRRGAGSES